jgi:hypothetical protein
VQVLPRIIRCNKVPVLASSQNSFVVAVADHILAGVCVCVVSSGQLGSERAAQRETLDKIDGLETNMSTMVAHMGELLTRLDSTTMAAGGSVYRKLDST